MLLNLRKKVWLPLTVKFIYMNKMKIVRLKRCYRYQSKTQGWALQFKIKVSSSNFLDLSMIDIKKTQVGSVLG